MESTLFMNYPPPQRFQHPYAYQSAMYPSVLTNNPHISPQSSFVRSSAQIQAPSPQQFYAYSQQHSPVDGYDDSSSTSSSGSSFPHDMNMHEQHQEYHDPNYGFTVTHASNSYPTHVSRSMWAQQEYSPPVFETSTPGTRYPDVVLANGVYMEALQKEQSYAQADLAPFYGGQDVGLNHEPALTAYTAQDNMLPSVVYSSTSSPRISTQVTMRDQSGSPPSVYGVPSPTLSYPPTPEDGVPSRFVSMQDISPSPTVSPDQVFTNLPASSPTHDYRTSTQSPFVASDSSAFSAEYDEPQSEVLSPSSALQRRESSASSGRKRRRVNEEDLNFRPGSADSGESEREDDGDDADDDEDYTPDSRDNTRSSTRRKSSRQIHTHTPPPAGGDKPRLPPPIPVPNLTKKSRGRRVPTNSVVVSQNGVEKNIRSYKCKVPGCNKCFQRGEHLKRHVRSIHTNEKPHKCPYKGCGKDFSRHDNLRQHMRVHRNDPLESEDTAGSA